MNILSWMYIDHVNTTVESLQKQIAAIESESVRKQKQALYDLITKHPPDNSKKVYSGKAYSKGQEDKSIGKKLLFILLLGILSFVIYQIIDLISSLVVFVVLFIVMIFLTMKPHEYVFDMYEDGMYLYGRYYPWDVFTSYRLVDTNGSICKIQFSLKEQLGDIPFWVSKNDVSTVKKYVNQYVHSTA